VLADTSLEDKGLSEKWMPADAVAGGDQVLPEELDLR
jgi:hypothetical protein